MDLKKAGAITGAGAPDASQLEKINRLTKTPLREEQVYVFSMRLCDDLVDRDFERFSPQALPKLAELFVGKTGICDHTWSSKEQVARIFDTRVEHDAQGSYLRAWAYMLREPEFEGIIREIEGGIKKEVSVGCAMGAATCSVCGKPYGTCAHQKGQSYDGQLCTVVLSEPADAYEFSFVAVPAQRQAGVMKAKGGGEMKLEEYVAKSGDILLSDSLKQLQREAELGRAYRKQLQDDAVKLGLCLDFGADEALLRAMVGQLDDASLRQLCKGLKNKASALLEPAAQLPGPQQREFVKSNEFMI